jgi:oxygen-independent coproporphyrinogen-3 oxidase
VPEWNVEFKGNSYEEALIAASKNTEDPLSLYFHIPFCWDRCLYCGCTVVISKRPEAAEKYLDYLYMEIARVAEKLGPRRLVKQLHWGGGTPTYLTPEQMTTLFNKITEHFEIHADAEIALEVDPRVTSREQLETLRKLGFNRISMGVQDLDPVVQKAVGRNQTSEETRELYDWCRDLEFEGINIDLIYGLPTQQMETWIKTIRAIIDIRPDRLAVYSYAHLPDKIKNQRHLDEFPRPTGPEKYELFSVARELFLEGGYDAIGMDHFALPEDELSVALRERRLHRNFMGYSVVPAADMVGFGVSAIGEVGGSYAQNEKRPAMYYKALDAGNLPTLCGIKLTQDDIVRRWTIRQIMCNFYLNFDELKQRFDVDYDTYYAEEDEILDGLYKEDFLVRRDDGLHVLPLGQVFIRNIAMVFDAYLKKPEHFTQFSQTV